MNDFTLRVEYCMFYKKPFWIQSLSLAQLQDTYSSYLLNLVKHLFKVLNPQVINLNRKAGLQVYVLLELIYFFKAFLTTLG